MPTATDDATASTTAVGRDRDRPSERALEREPAGDRPNTPPTAARQAQHHRLAEELQLHRAARCAPTASRTPISRVRCATDASITFMMPMPPTSSEIDAMLTSKQRQGARRFDLRLEHLVGAADVEVVLLAGADVVALAQQGDRRDRSPDRPPPATPPSTGCRRARSSPPPRSFFSAVVYGRRIQSS